MVQIITDSSSLYTPEEARAAGFEAVPLCVCIDDSHERDLLLDMDQYYEKIHRGLLPITSQPPLGDVIEAFETYVFNSRTLCGPHQYMVQTAQKMKESGSTAQEILTWLNEAADHSESFLIPQDFSFLKRGGRLTPLAAATGSVLKLKPIMKLTKDGKRLDKFGIKRTMASAAESIIDSLKDRHLGKDHILYISHGNALEDAQKIKALFQRAFQDLEIRILELSAAFVAQGGPRCVAIQYIRR